MSMTTLERAVLIGAKVVLNNQKLKMKDIQEWSTGNIHAQDGEIVVYVPDPGVWVAVNREKDNRKA